MDMTVEVMDPDFDPLDLQNEADQFEQIDSSELDGDVQSQNYEVDLSELTQLLIDHQDTTTLIQEAASQYFADSKQALEDLHSDLLMILLILILIFARACLSSARSLLEKSGKAVH